MTYYSGPTQGALRRPRGVHLVGSVPLSNNAAVFAEVSSKLGTHLRRMPDGETGDRANWTRWQFPLLKAIPQFEESSSHDGGTYRGTPTTRLQLRAGASISDVKLPNLGYRDAAIQSYGVFSQLKATGKIGPRIRFQVSLPTPLAVIHGRFMPRDQASVEQLYEQALLAELDGILAAIPATELAVQWDTAVEFSLLEGILDSYITDREAGVQERLLRLGAHVPPDVQLGYHLCYGDADHRHFKEPEDTSKMVAVANGVTEGLSRPLNWLHMPVPRDRTDEAYFAPLRDLRLRPPTELYLGLVHLTGGLDGTRARIAAAQSAVGSFGIGTECGLSRRDPTTIPDLLAIHARVADPW
ncbi:MAG: hypothetical protein O3B84_06105 [Chloroflexi bacterium]|nr:hypothetical protein [Chloroflexota bacterium]